MSKILKPKFLAVLLASTSGAAVASPTYDYAEVGAVDYSDTDVTSVRVQGAFTSDEHLFFRGSIESQIDVPMGADEETSISAGIGMRHMTAVGRMPASLYGAFNATVSNADNATGTNDEFGLVSGDIEAGVRLQVLRRLEIGTSVQFVIDGNRSTASSQSEEVVFQVGAVFDVTSHLGIGVEFESGRDDLGDNLMLKVRYR